MKWGNDTKSLNFHTAKATGFYLNSLKQPVKLSLTALAC